MADLPVTLADPNLTRQLERCLDVEGKIPRAFEALGPIAGRDAVLVDGAGGFRARQLVELGARLTVLEQPDRLADLRVALADLVAEGRVTLAEGSAAQLRLPDASADALVGCWSAFRGPTDAEVVEAERVLRPAGRLLALHDYGRDDVSRLHAADRPEYSTWSRRDGTYLTHGFKIRVIHCFWTFDSIGHGQAFLENAFGEAGRTVGAAMRRPRLSYNVAVYHRTKGDESAADPAA